MPLFEPIPVLVLIAVFGLLFGSFLNVCIARLPKHESVLRPGSHCPHCNRAIRPWQNIPLISFILLRGRCRSCHQPIRWRYPLVEAATAVLFVLVALRFGLNLEGYGWMVYSFLLLGLAMMDYETLLLPDTFTLPGILLGLVWQGLRPAATLALRAHQVAVAVLAAVTFALALLLIRWIYAKLRHREGLGLGDVKLIAMIAVWMGFTQTAEALFVAILAANIYALTIVARQSRKGLTTQLPLGLFLCAAALWTLFDGAPLLKWYLSFYR